MNRKFLLGFTVATLGVVAAWLLLHNRQPLDQAEPAGDLAEAPAKPAAVETAPSAQPPPEVEPADPAPTPAQPAEAPQPAPELRRRTPPPTNRPRQSGRQERGDPLAHVALAYVGLDPTAEAYWMEAIFDESLSDGERDDLMEDLNEAGFPDPRRPSPEDVPLILNRLAIIEEVVPYADDFMLNHLGEAYKDLVNMLDGMPPQ